MLADVPGGIEASNCSETSRLSIVLKATNFKGNSAKGLRRRDIMTELQKSASPEVRHRNREAHSRVNKFTQNLHVLKMAVKAEKGYLHDSTRPKILWVSAQFRGQRQHGWREVESGA